MTVTTDDTRHLMIEQCEICDEVSTYVARYASTFAPVPPTLDLSQEQDEWHWYIEGFDCGH